MIAALLLANPPQDVHSRYRSSSGASVIARFNERFILSLAACEDCLILDDELNVLPLSRGKDIVPLDDEDLEALRNNGDEAQLKELKENLSGDKLKHDLVKLAKTVDQVGTKIDLCQLIAYAWL